MRRGRIIIIIRRPTSDMAPLHTKQELHNFRGVLASSSECSQADPLATSFDCALEPPIAVFKKGATQSPA